MADPIRVAPAGAGGDVLEVMPLGAGREVGRSCCLVKFKGKSVLFDCGVHPAYSGLASLPFFDEMDGDKVDIALITHFHLDHCAGLPYLLERTNFNPKARIFMTHPTKAIYKALLGDFVRVSGHPSSNEENLYNEKDILRTMERIESVDYHQEINVNGIRFWAYNAGHVLGAAMFLVEIAGVRVLYTGDFSREEDRHLKAAEVPPYHADVLIVESTYGVQVHEPRVARETRFTQRVAQTVRRGGRVLLPVFALGRAQELLLILDEFWEAHPDLQDVPIYYASALAKRCLAVYQTYINMMNDNVKRRHEVKNPFAFKYVSNMRSLEHFDDSGPSVVMASPGMLQSGLSRELFERWCTDRRNACILLGYSVEGTLAKYIMTEPVSITRLADGRELPLRCSVDYITFSAHSDFRQTSQFIDLIRPNNVVLVHGEQNEMKRLAQALDDRYNRAHAAPAGAAGAAGGGGANGGGGEEAATLRIFTPRNAQKVELEFRRARIGKAIGLLPKRGAEDGLPLEAVIVRQDFSHVLVRPNDLVKYTSVKVSRLEHNLVLPLRTSLARLEAELRRNFDGVRAELAPAAADGGGAGDGVPAASGRVLVLGNGVRLAVGEGGDTLTLRWTADYRTDMLADTVSAMCLRLNERVMSDPLALELDDDYLERAVDVSRKMLSARFGSVLAVEDRPMQSRLVVDLVDVVVDHQRNEVHCEDVAIRERVRLALRRIHAAVFPIPDYYCECCSCGSSVTEVAEKGGAGGGGDSDKLLAAAVKEEDGAAVKAEATLKPLIKGEVELEALPPAFEKEEDEFASAVDASKPEPKLENAPDDADSPANSPPTSDADAEAAPAAHKEEAFLRPRDAPNGAVSEHSL